MAGFVLHSVLIEGQQVQVSYHDPEGLGPYGFEIRTPVITLTHDLAPELAEVNDAALQLVTAWEGLRRQPPAPGGLP